LKTNSLAPLVYAALFFACASNAQNPPAHQDTTKGNDVVGNPQPPPANPLATSPTTGQDKSTGNDLVGANKGQAQDTRQMRPDFDTLDTGKKGYLTAHDVKSHQWLSKHFTKCDLNHDGHLTQDEYANCHK
jgi:hypothetical protein